MSPSTSIWPQITGEMMCQSLEDIGLLGAGGEGALNPDWLECETHDSSPGSLIHQGDQESAC